VPKPYPPEFRRRALDLVDSGRTVRDVAAALGIAESCLYSWRSKDLIARGLKPAPASRVVSAELDAAHARIKELEDEVKILRKAAAAVEAVVPPKDRFQLVAELAEDGVPVKQACLSLGVSRSGYYEARGRAPSPRSIRHAWLTDLIGTVHESSRQTYGAPRVHAELTHHHGIVVGHNTVALLMRRAGIVGLPLKRSSKKAPASVTTSDLVNRDFTPRRPEPALGHRHHRTPPEKARCTAASSSTPGRGASWAGQSTPGNEPTWPPPRSAWPSIPAARTDRCPAP
jgi:transposase-like protein